MNRVRMTTAWGTLWLMMLLASSSWAQFSSGLEGTVFDPTGAVVPNATVTIKEVSTGVEHTTVTSSAGNYRFTALPASRFTLAVKAVGFETAELNDIAIQVVETRTLNVTLKLGAATQTVDVNAEVTPVNLAAGGVSGQVNEVKVHELPLVGRNMFSLVVLTPGVTGLPSGGGQAYAQATADIFNAELGVNLNANGQRAESNNFQVDGATTNGNPRGGVTNLTPNADSIQEVRIQTNNFSAEYGRNAAAIVNVVTKSGTNDYHGTLSWFHTDTHLNARTVFQPDRPVFLRNEFAGSVGGPIRKDKDFAFGSIDVLRSGVGVAFPAQVPTPELIDYVKTNLPNNISTKVLTGFPTTFQANRQFTTAGADVSGIDCNDPKQITTPTTAVSTPIGNLPCNFPVSGLGDFSNTVFRNGIQWSARIDHNWNDFKDRLYGSFYRTTRQTVEFASPSVYFPAFSPAEPEYTHVMNINWTHSAGASFVNQMTGSYTRTFGDAPCDHCEVPAMGADDGTALPGNGFIGLFRQNNYEWKDVATLTRGRQNFKFGANWARHHDDENFTDTTRRPAFQFANVLEFAADNPYLESNIQFDPRTGQVGVVNVDFAYRATDLGAFIQDDFKVRPNLTLNFGLRWETFTGPTERFDRLSNGVFQGGATFQDQIANLKMDHVPQLWHTRPDNFAPRFGFAWDPTNQGKTSIRGGAGVFYDRPANQLFSGDRNNLPLVANAYCQVGGTVCQPAYGLGASGQSPYNFPLVTGIQFGLNDKNGLVGTRTSQVITDPHLQVQYGENWSFGVQHEVFKDWVAEGDYIGSVGHHLYSSFNVNRVAGDRIANQGGIVVGYNTSFGGLFYGQANYNSAYNGGTFSIHNRGFTKGINFQAAYTFGKAIDQAQTFGPEPVDILNLRAERGLADFNVARRLSFSTLWQVPHVGSSSPIANVLLNGWQLSNITILQTGSPFTVFCSADFTSSPPCDYNADGTNNDRPNVIVGIPSSGFSENQFLNSGVFNCSASRCGNLFPAPGLGQLGNLGRNTFVGPGYINTDFSALKRTKIPWFVGKEGAQLEFRTEFFNVFNHVNLTGVNSDLAGGAFGLANGACPARDIQFGLTIEF
ncbi:MAG: hypothetical protein DMG24_02720 [Acidobacteria bacterium]|nr:MAG: hypothetical protein DMG24_02720 [Acidobacteriota bacterium]